MKLTNVTYGKTPRSCALCGHEIHNLYHVEHEGKSMIIGSECTKQHVDFTLVQQLNRYERQSAKEWRELATKPENEERGEYIARRINEKRAARRAWQAWKSISSDYRWPNIWPCEEIREQKIQEVEARFNIARSHWVDKTAYSI